MVWAAGFEPATSGIQGRHSNQTELHPETKQAPLTVSVAACSSFVGMSGSCSTPK